MKTICFVILLLTTLISSCRTTTEEYKDIAVTRAQHYIMDNVKNISMKNRKIIQYRFPRILKNELFLSRGQEINEYCFAWDLKEPKITVMVYGTGHKDFQDWAPVKVLFKKYKESDYKEITEEAGVWAEKPTFESTGFKVPERQTSG
ncbi:MAG: hypothetical protein K9M56_08290 [Victivallales bacterium]|nr:hypothetical protein [Victivallales bacterium]